MRRVLLVAVALWAAPALFAARANFEPASKTWTLSSDQISATFQLTSQGLFLAQAITHLPSGDTWSASPNQPTSPVQFTAGGDTFDAGRSYTLIDQYSQSIQPSGVRQYVVLQDLTGVAQITVRLEVYDGQPVLRYGTTYRNTGGSPVYVTA